MQFFKYFQEKYETIKIINSVGTATETNFGELLNEVNRMMERDDRRVFEFIQTICERALELGDVDVYNQLLSNKYIPNKNVLLVEIIEKAPQEKRLALLQSLDRTNIQSLSPNPDLIASNGKSFTISDSVYVMLLENNLIDINQKIYGSQTVETRDYSSDDWYGSQDVPVNIPQDPLVICKSDIKREALLKAGVDPNTPYPYLDAIMIANWKDLEQYLQYKSYNDIIHERQTTSDYEEMGML